VIEWLFGLMESTIGNRKDAEAFFPLVGTIFVYVLVSNLVGFIPGVIPATEDMSHNLALAGVVFLVFNYAGLSRNGFGYIKHLAGPVAAIAPVFFLLESFSLSVNIFVDHLLAGIVRGLGSEFLGFLGGAILPVPLFFLGLLVCVVQAFVFALLTTIYISLSVAHDDHGHGDDHDHAHAH
jgi:F-type H+-transporting ATPase subunit a